MALDSFPYFELKLANKSQLWLIPLKLIFNFSWFCYRKYMAGHNWFGPVANIRCNGFENAVLTQVWSNHSVESALLDNGHLNLWLICPNISWCLACGQMCAKQVLQEVQSGGISQTIKIGRYGNFTPAKGASKDNGHPNNSPYSNGSVSWESK